MGREEDFIGRRSGEEGTDERCAGARKKASKSGVVTWRLLVLSLEHTR